MNPNDPNQVNPLQPSPNPQPIQQGTFAPTPLPQPQEIIQPQQAAQNPQIITPTPAQPNPAFNPTAPQPLSPYPPVGQPAPVVGQVAQQPYVEPYSASKRKPILMAAGILVAVLLIGVFLFTFVLKHPITQKEITDTQNTAEAFNNDVYTATSALNNAQNDTTASSLNSDISKANTNLTAAQKQYALLKKSNVLQDSNVKKSFNALDAKWVPYLSYLQSSVKDTQTLSLLLIQFDNSLQSLSNNVPTTTAALSSYLTSFKQSIDSTTQQANSLKPILPEDKEILSALQTDLQSTSQVIAKAQGDLAAGSQLYVVEDDILGVSDAQDTFSTAINNVSSQINAKQTQLDPGTAFNNYLSALNKLSSTVKN